MKSPIDPSKMRGMPASMYAKKATTYLKKARDQGFSEVPCLVIESQEYSCGDSHAFTYYGSQSQVNKFFKELQKEKKGNKSLAFAKGVCKLTSAKDGKLELSFALKGFIKPDQVKKNKKKLFLKMGIILKDVVKGALDEVNEVVASISSEETQDVKVDEKSPNEDNSKSIIVSANKYARADKKMKQIILPLLKTETGVVYTQTHIEIAKEAYTTLIDFLEVCPKKEDETSTVLKKKPKLKFLRDSIVDNSLKDKYLKIWKKVELEYKKEIETLTEEEQTKLARVELLMKEIKQLEKNKKVS